MWQMAGRLRFPETSPGAVEGQDRDLPGSGGRPGERGTNAAIERWLQLHLRQLYEEVSNEPLPSELSDLIDRFHKRRQDAESGGDGVVPLPPAARQES